METFSGTLLQGIMLGLVYCLIGLGIVVVFKATRVFNLAYGEMLVLVAYVTYYLVVDRGLRLPIAIPLVFVFSTLLSLTVDRVVMRPLIGKPFLAIVISTLMLAVTFRGLTVLIWGGMPKVLPHFIPAGTVGVGGLSLSRTLIWCGILSIMIFILLLLFFRYTRTGLTMRAVAEDPNASRGLGIHVKRIYSLSWVISGVVGAAAGIFLSSLYVVDPVIGDLGLGRGLPIILLGGLESVPGVLIGGVVVGVVEMMTAMYVNPAIGGSFRDAAPFVLILLVLLVRPRGIFGQRDIERI